MLWAKHKQACPIAQLSIRLPFCEFRVCRGVTPHARNVRDEISGKNQRRTYTAWLFHFTLFCRLQKALAPFSYLFLLFFCVFFFYGVIGVTLFRDSVRRVSVLLFEVTHRSYSCRAMGRRCLETRAKPIATSVPISHQALCDNFVACSSQHFVSFCGL